MSEAEGPNELLDSSDSDDDTGALKTAKINSRAENFNSYSRGRGRGGGSSTRGGHVPQLDYHGSVPMGSGASTESFNAILEKKLTEQKEYYEQSISSLKGRI